MLSGPLHIRHSKDSFLINSQINKPTSENSYKYDSRAKRIEDCKSPYLTLQCSHVAT
jgi:hypothetical protein